jgi:hypothetical protein
VCGSALSSCGCVSQKCCGELERRTGAEDDEADLVVGHGCRELSRHCQRVERALSGARLLCHPGRLKPPSPHHPKNRRLPVAIIGHGVWRSHRCCRSSRDVEELLVVRGGLAPSEAIRQRRRPCGQPSASPPRRRRPRPGDAGPPPCPPRPSRAGEKMAHLASKPAAPHRRRRGPLQAVRRLHAG